MKLFSKMIAKASSVFNSTSGSIWGKILIVTGVIVAGVASAAALLTVGALTWGWILMVIAGATGHASLGYHDAFLWGYILALLSALRSSPPSK
jgi:hypothetical protein